MGEDPVVTEEGECLDGRRRGVACLELHDDLHHLCTRLLDTRLVAAGGHRRRALRGFTPPPSLSTAHASLLSPSCC